MTVTVQQDGALQAKLASVRPGNIYVNNIN